MTPCRRRPPEHKPQANPSTPGAVNPFPARNPIHAIALPTRNVVVNDGAMGDILACLYKPGENCGLFWEFFGGRAAGLAGLAG